MFKPKSASSSDYYKFSHPDQYPEGTEFVYSNTTPRSSRMEGVKEVVVFGPQYLVQEFFIDRWNETFFSKSKEVAIGSLKRLMDCTLGKDSVDVSRYEALWKLGYLPLRVKALPEGTLCPIGVPFMTIVNTLPEFYWLTNFVETLTQTVLWQGIVSATIAREYKKVLTQYAQETSDCPDFVQWQGHDFSMRGMSSLETGCLSGAAHLLSFTGTDTVPAIEFLEYFYGANVENELVGGSVPATEHAVMCAGGEDDEKETFRRLLEDIYPTGIVSVVSDTWDFWHVLNSILPSLKPLIMSRNGKLVIRPDSGDPVKIVTGYFSKDVNITKAQVLNKIGNPTSYEAMFGENDCVFTSDGHYITNTGDEVTVDEVRGAIQVLYNHFGGTMNSKGFIDLDPHIGLIYGDSITLTRCKQICERLKKKGFASTNVVFGIGSYTYQYNTRDTFSIACKATWVRIKGEDKPIFKNPKTDSGTKKSAKGLLTVLRQDGKLVLKDNCTKEEESGGELRLIFENGKMYNTTTLSEIRSRL